jgi:hypothetical protein
MRLTTVFLVFAASCSEEAAVATAADVFDGESDATSDLAPDGSVPDMSCEPPANLLPELFFTGCEGREDLRQQLIALFNSGDDPVIVTDMRIESEPSEEFFFNSLCGDPPFEILPCDFCEVEISWNPGQEPFTIGRLTITSTEGNFIVDLCGINGSCPEDQGVCEL